MAPLVLAGVLVAVLAVEGPGGLGATPPPPTPIVGGEEVELGRWDEVVSFIHGTRFCSGTMVAPRLVLTAAHCIVDLPPDAAGDFSVRFGESADSPQDIATVIDFGAFPDFCQTCNTDRFDLGYLLLEQTVSLPKGFPKLITDQDTWDELMATGEPLVMVGFGQTEEGTPTPGNPLGLGRKREVASTLRPYSDSGSDFLTGQEQMDTCQGDSGGPAFVMGDDGTVYLAGVLSGGLGPCGSGESVFSVPVSALSWIREETGIDLAAGECDELGCLETTRDGDDGCGCRTPDSGTSPPVMMWTMFLGAVALRRRRPARG